MATRRIDDTRRFRRRTVRILVDSMSDRGHRCDYATTLGAGGLFIETEEPLTAGDHTKVRFRLPNGETLHEIKGRVVWNRGGPEAPEDRHAPGMAIQFVDSVASAALARELEDLD